MKKLRSDDGLSARTARTVFFVSDENGNAETLDTCDDVILWSLGRRGLVIEVGRATGARRAHNRFEITESGVIDHGRRCFSMGP